jgi:O-antigen ligase
MTFEQAERPHLLFRYSSWINALIALAISFGSFTFVEPSPYDVLMLLLWISWAFSGFSVHRSLLAYIFPLLLIMIGGFLSLIPFFGETDSQLHLFYTVYLSISGIIFAIMFSEDALRRTDLCLRAYAVSALLAAACGIAGWFDIGGSAQYFMNWNRAMGPFKDPNVFGSYLVAGYLFFLHQLLCGAAKSWAARSVNIAALLILAAGVFLSFSRGSWGATLAATLLISAMVFHTTEEARSRARLLFIFAMVFGLVVAGAVVALSVDSIRDVFTMRASLNQDYDLGETGRFGNQLRSLPLLLDRPFGMGPLRYRTFFDLDPHNSYLANFADNGWLGGLSFMFLVGVTTFVGFRLCLKPSPYRRNAQVLFVALLMYFLQAFQIDIDHWRFVHLLLGAVWGLEAARQKWAEGDWRAARVTPPAQA